MKTSGILVLFLIAWALAGCTTSVRPVVYRPSAARPRFVEYKTGGYAAQERFVTDGVRACYEESHPRREFRRGRGFTLDYQVQTLPDANDWQKFWRAVDKLNLARWKTSYSQADVPPPPGADGMVVSDAGKWTLTIITPQISRRIEGDGAVPTAKHLDHATFDSADDALKPLEAAFRELVGLPPLSGS